MYSPTSTLPLDILATWAISLFESISLLIANNLSEINLLAFSIPERIKTGLTPLSTASKPFFIIELANTIAVVVPSPALSLVFEATSINNLAPIFALASSSSISLAIVTPSFVINGAP